MIYSALDWIGDMLCSVITGYDCNTFLSHKGKYVAYASKYATVYHALDYDNQIYWNALLAVAINKHIKRSEEKKQDITILEEVEVVCHVAIEAWEEEIESMIEESQRILLKALFPRQKDFDRVYNGKEILLKNLSDEEKDKLMTVASMLNKLWEQGQSPIDAAKDMASRISDF